MNSYNTSHYKNWNTIHDVPASDNYILIDHLFGFDKDFNNKILSILNEKSNTVTYHNILDQKVHSKYTNLNLKFSSKLQESSHLFFYDAAKQLKNVKRQMNNFICSFNNSFHVSRSLLVAALYKKGWFTDCCSKNFKISVDQLDGFIIDQCGESERLHRKFIVPKDENFCNKIITYNFNNSLRYDHISNIAVLEPIIKRSFIHIVSETNATSYQPFVTEKPFYSILNKGLWLAYAAPNYHKHLEYYYGFKKYKIFNYEFDLIQNPIERLIEMLSSVSKFSNLSIDDWNDLYLMEKDTIEFNYDHYLSRSYMNNLKKFDNSNI